MKEPPAMRIAALLALTAAMAACAPSRVPPPTPALPVPQPAPAPARPAPLPEVPRADNWIDAAPTLGTWRYGAQGARSEAVFVGRNEAPMMRLRCEADRRMVVLSLPESGAPRPLVTIRTQTTTRTIAAQPGGRETLVMLDPRDPLLDAMAFARGRFAIEADGLGPLYLPSWAEVARVIEDCR